MFWVVFVFVLQQHNNVKINSLEKKGSYTMRIMEESRGIIKVIRADVEWLPFYVI